MCRIRLLIALYRPDVLAYSLDVDNRINQVIDFQFDKQDFWERGGFPAAITNGSEQISVVRFEVPSIIPRLLM